MSARPWFRPPHQLIALFVLITLVPSFVLIVFGWRLLQQERALGLQRIQERREQAADLVVASLQQSLSVAERQLEDSVRFRSLSTPEDSVAVVFTPDRVEAFPEQRLLYYPHATTGNHAPAGTFATGEGLEFRDRDYSEAASFYRGLTNSATPSVRAGALIRLARTLRKDGQWEAARAAYDQAAELSGVTVADVPVDLLARWAACDLLAAAGRDGELTPLAEALYADLVSGRWQLDRTTYTLHVQDAIRWVSGRAADAPAPSDVALAAAAEWLWHAWQDMPQSEGHASDRVVLDLEGRQLTVLWSREAERLTALIAGPLFVERQWLHTLTPMLERQHARVALRHPAAQPASSTEARRAHSDTGLPWTVAVDSIDVDAQLDQFAGRRGVWMAGLAMFVLLVLLGGYVIARAVTRELAVARLQSDFVSAVSHEFRTPLTSMRQLTEILTDGRVASPERRRTYYQALARQTQRLHQLVESLLDFGRMEAGVTPYRLEPLDAGTLTRSVVEQFEREAATRGYHVELSVDDAVTASVHGDRDALTSALWNLLDNAVKYSPDCRTVWVRVEREDHRLAIRVRDRGIGVPPEEQQDILAKFVRGATAKAQNITGTGIGLAMVEHILHAHHGALRLESQPGAGSTFTMLLPLEEPCRAS